MIKKTLLAAPLAVLAMGLTSCGSWPKVANDKATEIAKKIYEYSQKEESMKDFKSIEFSEKDSSQNKGYRYNSTSKTFTKIDESYNSENNIQIDSENKYGKEVEKGSDKDISGTSTHESTDYTIYDNGYGYELNKNKLNGSKGKVAEDDFKSELKEGIISTFTENVGHVYDYYLKDLSSVIKGYDETAKEIEKLGSGSYLKYHFESKNDTSLKICTESKVKNQDLSEQEGHKFIFVDSFSKSEIVIENNIVTKIYNFGESTINEEGKERYSKYESTRQIKINSSFGRDSINLSDYSVKEEK